MPVHIYVRMSTRMSVHTCQSGPAAQLQNLLALKLSSMLFHVSAPARARACVHVRVRACVRVRVRACIRGACSHVGLAAARVLWPTAHNIPDHCLRHQVLGYVVYGTPHHGLWLMLRRAMTSGLWHTAQARTRCPMSCGRSCPAPSHRGSRSSKIMMHGMTYRQSTDVLDLNIPPCYSEIVVPPLRALMCARVGACERARAQACGALRAALCCARIASS